jgi:hypothetical protein
MEDDGKRAIMLRALQVIGGTMQVESEAEQGQSISPSDNSNAIRLRTGASAAGWNKGHSKANGYLGFK